MPFTIQDILTLKVWRWRVWGFFELFPFWKQLFLLVYVIII